MSDAIREMIAAKLTELEAELASAAEREAYAKQEHDSVAAALKGYADSLNAERGRVAALKAEIESAKRGLAAFDPARVRRARGEKRPVTDETRARMSAAHKARHEAKRAAGATAETNGAATAE